ncbi:zinc transporter ZupT [Salipaludibacillus sp. HK11]|uniref:zinc transporter ZupT n=1 Tax=Salipaludibacillus sp. HK11 TaxID=3394320 RepID=UPI0039FD0F13
MTDNILFAFNMTLIAGLATGIGSILAFFTSKTNTTFLSFALGFSAGVMIYISMVDIFYKARILLVAELGEVSGNWATVAGFFSGMFIIAIIDQVIPEPGNPHNLKKVEEMQYKRTSVDDEQLLKMGSFTALAIAIHNFPEGMATFMAALQDPALGVAIAIAVAIHNIPEGIAISVPIYYATGDKAKAFKLSFMSGLAEPLGAIVAFLILMPYLNDVLFGVVFAAVAGIMIFISLDELLPAAKKYDETHTPIYGVMTGMAVMAISLLLLI